MNKMNKKKRLILILTIVVMFMTSTLTACSSKKKETPKANEKTTTETAAKKYGNVKGCIWEIKNGNSSVYLYGSIHIAKKDMFPFEKTIEDAFDKSNNLVVEADVTDTAKVLKLQSKLFYPGDDNVYNHLSKEGKEKIDVYSKELGINMDLIKKTRLWAVGSFFLQAQLQKAGYSSNDGVDMYFLNKAKNKKKILELEGIEYQFNLINGMSDAEQEASFFSDVKDMKECQTEFDKMYDTYKAGDENAMDKLLNGSQDKNSESYKKLIVDRNKGMADKIEGYLKSNDSYFVVAGLFHYVGDDSVVKLLEQRGYKVTRK